MKNIKILMLLMLFQIYSCSPKKLNENYEGLHKRIVEDLKSASKGLLEVTEFTENDDDGLDKYATIGSKDYVWFKLTVAPVVNVEWNGMLNGISNRNDLEIKQSSDVSKFLFWAKGMPKGSTIYAIYEMTNDGWKCLSYGTL